MTQAILVINKRDPKLRYFVRVEDWVNDNLYVIDADMPFTGDTMPILKSEYMAGGIIDENGNEESFLKGGENECTFEC
jgi:hypothetical protein